MPRRKSAKRSSTPRRTAECKKRQLRKSKSDNAVGAKRRRGAKKRKAGGPSSVKNISTSNKTNPNKSGKRVLSLAAARRADIHPLDRAIAELRAELARAPEDTAILSRLGALFYRRGDLAEAEKFYRRAIELAPQKASLHNNLGNVLCDMGRMRDGIAAYEHAMELERAAQPDHPPSGEALANLDMARMEYKLVHERIEYLERASQLEVSSAEALNALGSGYLLRGLRQKALDTFRKAAALDPRNAAAGLNVAFAHTLNLDGTSDLQAALSETAETAMRFPQQGRIHIHQGELLENAGLLDEAEERYVRAMQAEPRCLDAYDVLGRLREATGTLRTQDDCAKTVEAILQQLERTAREARLRDGMNGGGEPLYDLAFVQIARARFLRRPLEQPATIDALLREAGHAGGEGVSSKAALLRAQLLEADGRRDEARVVLDNACAADPRNARLWFERGSLALRSGDVDEALRAIERATLAAPQDAVAHHSLRFALEGYRRYRTERVRFDSRTKANPRDGLAHHHLALAALSVLKDEEALFHFTRALEMDPRLSDAACGRGRALQRLGHLDEAESAYEKALDIDPDNAEAHRSLLGLRSQKLQNRIFFAVTHGRG